ncbi:MAG: hypothetical protein GHCLOJNM_02130 [bacterium]|nr:hypothetical protein [bacterium]
MGKPRSGLYILDSDCFTRARIFTPLFNTFQGFRVTFVGRTSSPTQFPNAIRVQAHPFSESLESQLSMKSLANPEDKSSRILTPRGRLRQWLAIRLMNFNPLLDRFAELSIDFGFIITVDSTEE